MLALIILGMFACLVVFFVLRSIMTAAKFTVTATKIVAEKALAHKR